MSQVKRVGLVVACMAVLFLPILVLAPGATAAINDPAGNSGAADGTNVSTGVRTAVRADLPSFVPGELILKLKEGKSAADLDPQLLGRFRSITKREFSSKGDRRFANIFKVKTRESDLESLSRDLHDDPAVEYASLNHILVMNFVPNDSLYPYQWSHARSQAAVGWDIERGNHETVIAIVDSGVAYTHEDLAANVWHDPLGKPGKDFVAINTNDYTSMGYQLINGEDYTGVDDDPSDYLGHGTHCAGIAGAVGNNGKGISGACPNCAIMPVRAGFAMLSGSTVYGLLAEDAIASAVTYATDNGADIISMSFGGQFGSLGTSAIEYAYSQGVVLIAAAGNGNSSAAEYALPASMDHVIAVAATNSTDGKASYSNWGSWVDVAAPGGEGTTDIFSSITSTVPYSGPYGNITGYNYLSGTSMAGPYVAGLAGLILSKNSLWTNDQVYTILRQGVDVYNQDISPPIDVYIGTGRVNVHEALSINSVTGSVADILQPSLDFLAGGSFGVSGTTTAPYRVFRGQGIYPASWTEIGSGPAADGLLGVIDSAQLSSPFDTYTINLRAEDAAGWIEDSVSGDIGTQFLPGWPQSYSSSSMPIWNGPTLADVDRDGFDEIITTGQNAAYQGIVSVHRRDGTLVAGWPQTVDGSNSIIQSGVAVGDINNDGVPELVASVTSSYSPGLYCWDASGHRLWKKVLDPVEPSETVALADVNGDGFLEIITKTRQKHLFVVDRTGTPLWSYFLDYYSGDDGFHSSAVADLDGDGRAEIITSVKRRLFQGTGDTCAPFGGTLYVFNGDGTVRWLHDWPEGSDMTYPCRQITPTMAPVAVDMDLDGRIEIVSKVKVYTKDTSGNTTLATRIYLFDDTGAMKPGWPRTFSPFSIFSNATVADVNLDGYPEVIAATLSNLHVLKSDGAYLFAPVPYGSESDPVVGDVTGDGMPDILLHVNKTFRVVEAGGMVSTLPPRLNNIGSNVNNAPILTDLDQNGSLDLIFSENSNRKTLSAWDLFVPRLEYTEQWRMFGFDPQHTFHYVPRTLPPNNPPVAVGQSVTTAEDTALAVTLAATDVDGDPLTYAVLTDPAHGTLAGTAPNLTYTPAENYNGTDSFTFTANDGTDTSAAATVTITVTPVNDPPVAADDVKTTAEDTAVSIPVLANDYDIDGGTLSIFSVSQPGNGSAVISGTDVTYSPVSNWSGTHTFTYTVTDGLGGYDTATVTVTVTPGNDPPVAVDDTASTKTGVPVAIPVLANDTDVDGDLLAINSYGYHPDTHGTLAVAGASILYTPDPGWSGTSTFGYTVSDGHGGYDAAVVTVTVLPPKFHIESISMSIGFNRTLTFAAAVVMVVNESGTALPGVALTGHWSGLTTDTESGVTDGAGLWIVNSDSKKNLNGTFTFTVDTATLAGYEFDHVASMMSVSLQYPAPPPPGGAMHVASITMGLKTSGKTGTSATASVMVVNADGAPVASASVAGSWSGPVSGPSSGATDATGKITLTSAATKTASGKTFTFTVTGITKSGWTYDPAANIKTSNSITAP